MSGRSFRFSLSPVLALRDQAVEASRTALGLALARRQAAQALLDQARAQTDPPAAPAQTVHTLRISASHRSRVTKIQAAAERALHEARAAERAQRAALAVAVREREAMASLRDAASDAHRSQALRSEIATLDDLALSARRTRA